jgi:hypothetical protein
VTPDDVPLLREQVGLKPMLMCPWCEEWLPRDSFTALNMPPAHQSQLSVIYKHGGEGGCKRLFALRSES